MDGRVAQWEGTQGVDGSEGAMGTHLQPDACAG